MLKQNIKHFIDDLFSEKDLTFWRWYLSGYLSFFFWIASFIWVLSLLYPNIFTTPEMRFEYPVEIIRSMIFYFMSFSIWLGILSFIYFKKRVASSVWILFSLMAIIIGGSNVNIWATEWVFHLWLDWFIISLLIYGPIFIIIEKIFPLKKTQNILREWWSLDMKYYFINHLLWGIVLILINHFIQNYLWFLIWSDLQLSLSSLYIILQVILIFLITDFVQYWIHRSYHEIPFLWKIHAVHHSAEKMDWLAGSRMHILEMIITRSVLLITVVLLGFSESAINIYIIIVSFWATFIHLNMNIKIPYLDKIFVWPRFHHWHHSKSKEAINKNYAWQLAFYDFLFKTALYKDEYPESYWIVYPKNYPQTLIEQTVFPFKKKKKIKKKTWI